MDLFMVDKGQFVAVKIKLSSRVLLPTFALLKPHNVNDPGESPRRNHV